MHEADLDQRMVELYSSVLERGACDLVTFQMKLALARLLAAASPYPGCKGNLARGLYGRPKGINYRRSPFGPVGLG